MIKCSGIASQRTSCWTAKATSASQISVSPLDIICNLSNLYFDFDQKFSTSYHNIWIWIWIYDISYLDGHFQVLRSRSLRARQLGAVWARWGTFIFVFCDICICIVWRLYLYSMTFVFLCFVTFVLLLYNICNSNLWHLYFYFMTFVLVFYDICICIIFYNICLWVLFHDTIILIM